jgi:hypothetical protein
MPFKKTLYIDKNKEDSEEDDEEADGDDKKEKQIAVVFPGMQLPATCIPRNLARNLTKKIPELRMKLKSKIKGIDLSVLKIKK